jgi:hypothetical protein
MLFLFANRIRSQDTPIDPNTIPTWKTYDLKGRVKICTQYKYYAILKSGIVQKGKRLESDMHDEMDVRLTFLPSGKILMIEDVYFAGKEVVYLRSKYVYDKKGDLVSPKNESVLVDHDSLKRPVRIKYLTSDGKINHEDCNTYDREGRLAGQIFRSEGKIYSVEKYAYDKDRKIIYRYADTSGPAISVSWQRYHMNRHLLEDSTIYVNEKFYTIERYAYNKEGNMTLHYSYKDGKLVSKKSSEYTYDRTGNCIRAVNFWNGDPMYIEERKYVYY